MGGIRGPSRTGLERKQWADGDVCYCVCIDELTDVCLYIHVCMPIYEKLYRCKTLNPVKLGGILQSSQQGQDFPHLGNTRLFPSPGHLQKRINLSKGDLWDNIL